ncbi:UNVERIFIED_CONTAM: hypothetical protein PYX00_006230 [Menopon gallinae]|uniref:UBA domain-containing protein n=1 Tax=Menopon gallinae TaxID=328185 RepID=A0AAW2HUE9_9NEOP
MIPWMKVKIYGSRERLSNMWRNRNGSSKKDSTPTRTASQTLGSTDEDEKLKMYITAEGGTWLVGVDADMTVEKLKIMALTHFFSSAESQKLASKYRLVCVSERRTLPNGSTLIQEGLHSEDELLLVEAFTPPPKDIPPPDSLRGPTSNQINSATHGLKPMNTVRKNPQPECAADFHHEVRKILMSLCEVSAKVLSPTPDAQKVIKLLNEQLSIRRLSELNPLSVKALVDMGFTRQQAVRALKKNFGHREAFEWLLEHANDPASDSEEELDSPGPSTSQSTGSNKTLVQAVDEMLEKFRRIKEREFKPNPKSVALLQEMGFSAEDAQEALRITGNNQNAACEWLIGDRRPSLQDLDRGLDPKSPIYEAIMNNASVQLSLSNPRMLLAFLSILDNPNSANLWLNDPEAAPALNTIFKIYHSEKHVNRLT